MKKIHISGQRFGRLVALREGVPHQSPSRRHVTWECQCDCGSLVTVRRTNLTRPGGTQSCGCIKQEIYAFQSTRFMQRKPEYNCWAAMKDRCNNPNNLDYKDYGGRGISVCSRWTSSFDDFFADMGARPSRLHSIDRIDVNGGYSPENCKWATAHEQSRNKRNNRVIAFAGQSKVLSDWADDIGICFSSLVGRLKRHPTHIALTLKKGSRHVS